MCIQSFVVICQCFLHKNIFVYVFVMKLHLYQTFGLSRVLIKIWLKKTLKLGFVVQINIRYETISADYRAAL